MLHPPPTMPPRPPVVQTSPALAGPSLSDDSLNPATIPDHGRVWVHQSAIDEIRKAKKPALRRTNSAASFRIPQDNSVSSFTETESCTDHSCHSDRNATWAWKEALLVENGNKGIVLKLADPSLDDDLQDPNLILPLSAWNQGNVVIANEFESDSETGLRQPPSDLITLTHLHEPAVVESLQLRFASAEIYTNTGPVLLAVNPFQNIRGMYGESIQKRYWDKAEKNLTSELPPHVYAIADSSFRSMMRALEDEAPPNQSILVSGESGAGKTVTTKFVMKYLAALSQRSAVIRTQEKRAYVKVAEGKQQTAAPTSPRRMCPSKTKAFQSEPSWASPGLKSFKKSTNAPIDTSSNSSNELANVTLLGKASQNSIEAIVLQSNPILESFGNARTVRNDNSSRFGKFIEIQFSSTGRLVGANIDTYLLEKVRLCRQLPGERNFHVFYELLHERDELPTMYYIAPSALPEDFKLLSSSGTYDRRDGVFDAETYRALRSAMSAMGFSIEEIQSVFSVTAAVLHASNLNFVDTGDDTSALDEDNVHLQPVCHLLGVTEEELNYALTAFTITAGRSHVQRSLNVEQAEKGLQALLQTTYGALFEYLVQRINESIAAKRQNKPEDESGEQEREEKETKPPILTPSAKIGVLDIFGFESFQKNSFEQLCINFCNEALQQQFNAFVLKNEQEVYEKEGIEWSFIEFPENQDVLDLIEKRGNGILSILDDQCRAPGPSDKAFAMNLYSRCKGSSRFTVSRKQSAYLQFSINHYAGPVEYSTDGFIEKNKDDLPKEIVELLKTSSLPFIQDLAFIMDDDAPDMLMEGKGGKFQRSGSFVGRPTVGGQFRSQLRELRDKIELTSPHYIRCLKPNDILVPEVFDTAIVAEQLRCGGILEAVRVARAGFTQHYPHTDFVRRYRSLAWRELSSASTTAATSQDTARNYGGYNRSGSYRNGGPFRGSISSQITPKENDPKQFDAKAQCRELVKALFRKLRQMENQSDENGSAPPSPASAPASPAARAKSYSFQKTPNSLPSWSKNSPFAKKKLSVECSTTTIPPMPLNSPSQHKNKFTVVAPESSNSKVSRPSSPWKRGGLSSADYLKVGIQMGKTKVFLRHQCFESLERMRSLQQTEAATKLNSIFRRYLARIAYIPYRNAFRREMAHHRVFPGDHTDEKKESDFDSPLDASYRNSRPSVGSCNSSMMFSASFDCKHSLVDKWQDSMIRDAIHNPIPRHEWGKQMPANMMEFKWLLKDGIWVKNYSYSSDDDRR